MSKSNFRRMYELGRVLTIATITFHDNSWLLVNSTSPLSSLSLPQAILYSYTYLEGTSQEEALATKMTLPLGLARKESANTKISLSLDMEMA